MKHSKVRFVERGTHYDFDEGKLSVYETNCPCKDVEFYFDKYMITMMASGHKTVLTENMKVELFPGMVFIPEKNIKQKISIANASFSNPTQCLVLELSSEFLESFYLELVETSNSIFQNYDTSLKRDLTHFFLNDEGVIESFLRLYKSIKTRDSKNDDLIQTIMLKELLLRLFQTEAGYLLINNFHNRIKDKNIKGVVHYIKTNLSNKITIEDLVDISGISKTKFFNRFKENLGVTPVKYILNERINYSKKLIKKRDNLKNVAFQSGFNTYEHFCNSFKKVEGVSPSNYKKITINKESDLRFLS